MSERVRSWRPHPRTDPSRSRHRTQAGHSRLASRRQTPVALQGGPDARCQPSIKLIPERFSWGVGERSRAGSPVSVARDPAPLPLAWVGNRPQKVQVLDPRRLVPLLKLLVVHYVVRLRCPEPVAQLVASIEVRQLEPGPELQPGGQLPPFWSAYRSVWLASIVRAWSQPTPIQIHL
jgi:hypothetical protein